MTTVKLTRRKSLFINLVLMVGSLLGCLGELGHNDTGDPSLPPVLGRLDVAFRGEAGGKRETTQVNMWHTGRIVPAMGAIPAPTLRAEPCDGVYPERGRGTQDKAPCAEELVKRRLT